MSDLESSARTWSADAIIRALYLGLLQRQPDNEGLAAWVNELNSGTRIEEVVIRITESDEFSRDKQKYSKDLVVAAMRHVELLERLDAHITVPLQAWQAEGLDVRIRGPAHDKVHFRAILASGHWEHHISRVMMRTLTAGTTFVDVGGAIGYHTVIGAALTGKTGHVISFEPQAAQRRFIEDNIRLNGLTNVTLLPYGLLDRRATLPLHISELSPAGATLGAISDPREDRIETVECVPFDDLVDAGDIELSRLDLVKIDTEGADALVLDGMSRAVRVFRPTIVVELLAPLLELFGLRPKDLWDRFADLGYEALALPWEFQKPALADLPHRVLWGDIPAIPFETCAQLDEALAILGEHYPNFGIDLLALPKAESSSH